MTVLFVCTGNICRSPVAEHLLRYAVPGCDVASAGTAGMTGYPMDPRSLDYLRGRGIDGSAFTARRVNRRILRNVDLVVGMEQAHVDACLAVHPGAVKSTFRLSQLADWQRSGALGSLDDLARLRPSLPVVDTAIGDPVDFTDPAAYVRVLDTVADDVAALAALITDGYPADR